MTKLKIFCVTNEQKKYLEKLPIILAGVGNKKFSKVSIMSKRKNIQHKEQYYSELTFHYWYWKINLKMKIKILGSDFHKKEDFG